MNKYALLSVSDRRNIEKLALALNELGYAILATKGTSTYLDSMGINNIEIAQWKSENASSSYFCWNFGR